MNARQFSASVNTTQMGHVMSAVASQESARNFAIALSFPGTHRDYVRLVAEALSTAFETDEAGRKRVFYDAWHEAHVIGYGTDQKLQTVYGQTSDLIVPFFCQDYLDKEWCGVELRAINELLFKKQFDRVLPFRFDMVKVPGSFETDVFPIVTNRPATEIADLILERYNQLFRTSLKRRTSRANGVGQAAPTDISRILKYAPAELIGREDEMAVLNAAWDQAIAGAAQRARVLTFVAMGGEGKTSLVAKWAADLAHRNWPGCEAVFAWSFYSQGSREQAAVSSDVFLAEALTFFGDSQTANSSAGAFDKAKRLAQLVSERRAVLILDGLEPLQYPPGPPMKSKLKDEAIAVLLKELAARSKGLCVVTTRYSIPDLKAYRETTAPERPLLRLSTTAGVALLKSLEVHGTAAEFEQLVEDVRGHALTLNLLGSYLRDAHGGDIRRRDLVKLEDADAEEQGGHAFRVLDAYVKSFEDDDHATRDREGEAPAEPHGQREPLVQGGSAGASPSRTQPSRSRQALALLSLMGLFDRPASVDCLQVLWSGEPIVGLTEPLVGLGEVQRNLALKRLEDARLLTVNRNGGGALVSLDTHPLIREYFAKRLRGCGRVAPRLDSPVAERLGHEEAWRTAQRRLYEHLCATTPDKPDATLEDLQPLYQAIAHGCHAGLQQEACAKVYRDRIKRRNENYSSRKLGAFGSDLGAVACFFETPWSRVSPTLTEAAQAWLLNEAAFRLRALGRLTEALEPMRVSGEMDVKVEEWKGAAISYSNLSELELTLGEVAGAVRDAEQSVTYADRSGDAAMRRIMRTTLADALHQAGRGLGFPPNGLLKNTWSTILSGSQHSEFGHVGNVPHEIQQAAKTAAGSRSHELFREAEQMQAEDQPEYPLLYSVQGFQYCDLLLAEAEQAAWQATLDCGSLLPLWASQPAANAVGVLTKLPMTAKPTGDEALSQSDASGLATESGSGPPQSKTLHAVIQRATQTLKWVTDAKVDLLSIALDHLTLGRAALYAAILNSADSSNRKLRISDYPLPLEAARSEIDQAVSGLRHAGQQQYLPLGLLTRAWLRSLCGVHTGPDSAQSDLDEAWEIAERGPMPLFLADILLHRARLFGHLLEEDRESRGQGDGGTKAAYPWVSVKADLAEARRLIEKHGYGRRLPELEDAEAALLVG